MRREVVDSPLVFDIARGSFVDGPGLRTVVFFKGCPLRCLWCHNPESRQAQAETFFDPEKCIGCGNCAKGDSCNTLARQTVGVYHPPWKLARLILRDRVFYQTSSGGVTFSGGEPLLFIDYIFEVAKILKREAVHMAVETCGLFDFDAFAAKLLPLIDLYLFDIKVMDPLKHKQYTGKSNAVIIQNFKKLLAVGARVIPRVPLVPGYTATKENLRRVADFFLAHDVTDYRLLPYNPSGLKKWQRLGKEPPAGLPHKPLTLAEEQEWIRIFKKRMAVKREVRNIGDAR